MKKLDVISNKIQNNNSNYFGRGHFETIIKDNSEQILTWFEELVPVQEQIKELILLGCVDLQKRNYVRIVTKLFPQEYSQFIAMNIILRDIDSITAVFKGIFDTRTQYDTLLNHGKLKFPGKHQKYVDFHTYQQFVTFYKEDLINRAINFEIDKAINIEPNQQYIYNVHAKKDEVVTKEEICETKQEEILEEAQKTQEHIDETSLHQSDNKEPSKEKTNWMKVLLKGV